MNAPASTPAQLIHHEDALPSLASTLRHVALVQQVLSSVMKDGTHYGASFPGDKKKNLLKPGADALCLAFRLVSEFVVDERDLGNDHRQYQITCTLRNQGNGGLIATGVGSCSTKENKYRYRSDKPKCPSCGQPSAIKTARGWWCVPDKGGCGINPDAAAMESQPRGKIENPDIADVWNTVLKIAKKRAYVDATITATAASDMFTQDLEDMEGIIDRQEAKAAQRVPEPAPEPVREQRRAAPAQPDRNAVTWTADQRAEAAKLAKEIEEAGGAAELAKIRNGAKGVPAADVIDAMQSLLMQCTQVVVGVVVK